MSRRARRKESPRINDSRLTIPFSVPDKNIDDRPTRGKYHLVREKSSKNEMNPSKNKPERFLHFWNPQDL